MPSTSTSTSLPSRSTLLPGDVLLTGTPAGISVLRDGNEVEVEVEGIGAHG